MPQLVVVSNRVALPDKSGQARAGGLEVAVKAALKQRPGTWFGWSGKVATHTKIAPKALVQDGITYITLDLSKEDHHEYYNGFTNRVLWPILHYRVDLAEFSRRARYSGDFGSIRHGGHFISPVQAQQNRSCHATFASMNSIELGSFCQVATIASYLPDAPI